MPRGTILFGKYPLKKVQEIFPILSSLVTAEEGPSEVNFMFRNKNIISPYGSGGNFIRPCFACAFSPWHILPEKTDSELLFSVTAFKTY
jgi:hypothetical protein